MSILSTGGKKQAQQAPSYTGLDIQTSAAGKAITIAVGTIRLAPNLIWYGNFQTHKQETSGAGGKGGSNGGGSVSYTYSASMLMALCEGPIDRVGTVWVGKSLYDTAYLGMTLFPGTYTQTPWGYLDASFGATSETDTIPGTGRITVSEASTFTADGGVVIASSIPMTKVSGYPGPLQYSVTLGSFGFYQFNAANAGQTVVISFNSLAPAGSPLSTPAQAVTATIPASAPYTVATKVSTDKGVILAQHALTAVTGTPGPEQYSVVNGVYTFNAANYGQKAKISYNAWSIDTQALPYPGVAYIAVANYNLGSSPDLSNHNFEVYGFYSTSVPGQVDADASLFVADALSNPHWGVGFPSNCTGNLSTYQSYVLSAGLLVSFSLDSQTSASQILADLMTATNSEFVWSEGVLNIVPYGDQPLTGNGHTYTPPSSPVIDLTDDDYIIETTGDDPVQMTRSRPSDAYNSIQVEYLNRTNAYNTAIAEADDQAAIDLYGLRRQSGSGTHLFCLAVSAQLSAQLQLQRQAIRNTYQFNTDERYIWLDPMDIITLTDSAIGLNRQWVRITEIDLNDDGTLTFTAEEYLQGTGHAAQYSLQSAGGFGADYNADPGNTNAPVILEAPVQIATTSGLEVWLVMSGGPAFGGADVYVSTDGDSYKYVGTSQGQGRQGLLFADLPSGSDPDIQNIAYVSMTESGAQLLSGTQTDADLGHTLCYVGGELISFATATPTDTYDYALTYLRRGMYGTTVSDHPVNTQFARLDQSVFVYSYDKSQIGQTIYIKLLAFNQYEGGHQQLNDVEAYTHLIKGPPVPPDIEGFTAQQNGGAVVFRWDEVIDYALKGYDILYSPQGQGLTTAKFLTEATRGTEMTNASVPPGNWTFYIQGHDIADQVSASPATFNLTVTNENDVIEAAAQAPLWSGTLDGFYHHWTDVLIPLGTKTCSAYTVLSPPTTPVLSFVSGGSLPARTYYVTLTYTTASGETLASSESTIALAASTLLSVTGPADSGEATGWNVYVSESSGTETKQDPSPLQIGAGWTEPTTGLTTGASLPTMNTTGWEVFNVSVPDPVSEATYTAPVIDTDFVSTFRVWAAQSVQMLPTDSGIPDIGFEIAYSDTLGAGGPIIADDGTQIVADDGTPMVTDGTPLDFIDFETGLITARYVTARLTLDITPGSVPYLTGFTPTIDVPPDTVTLTGVAIASGGTYVPYPQQFHNLPNVQVTATSTGATSGVASAETNTGCTVTLYNGSVSVAGTANLTIEGV